MRSCAEMLLRVINGLLFLTAIASEPASVYHSPKSQFLILGQPGIIPCYIQSSPKLIFVIWRQNQRQLLEDEARGISILPNGSLSVASVTRELEGSYRCTPYNSDGTQGSSGVMHVSVVSASENLLVFSSVPRDSVSIEGEQTVLTCQVSGNATYSWFRNGANIDLVPWLNARASVRQGGELVINHTSAEDSGHYACQVDNELGQSITATAYLDVQYPARVVYSPNVQYIAVGTPGTIFCEVEANPPSLFVTWTLNNVHFDPTMVPGVVAPKNGSLHFNAFHKENEGVYSCTAYNSFGTAGSSNNMNVLAVKDPEKDAVRVKRSATQMRSRGVAYVRSSDFHFNYNEKVYLIWTFVLILGLVLTAVMTKICEVKKW